MCNIYKTAFHFAVEQSNLELIKSLLSYECVDPNILSITNDINIKSF